MSVMQRPHGRFPRDAIIAVTAMIMVGVFFLHSVQAAVSVGMSASDSAPGSAAVPLSHAVPPPAQIISFEGATGTAIPIVNTNTSLFPSLPRRFRATTAAFLHAAYHTSLSSSAPHNIDFRGLSDVAMSGSAQYSVSEFRSVVQFVQRQQQQQLQQGQNAQAYDVWVIDLRQEPHAFINDQTAMSWFGNRDWATYGLDSVTSIENLQTRLIDAVFNSGQIVLYNVQLDRNDEFVVEKRPVEVRVQRAVDEGRMIQSQYQQGQQQVHQQSMYAAHYQPHQQPQQQGANVHYIHVPTLDHLTPTQRTVQQFLTALQTIYQHAGAVNRKPWIHFHCAQGDGRTTLFMAMYDCVMNGRLGVQVDQIVHRQSALGGIDLFEYPDNWKRGFYIERAQFLRDFCASYTAPPT